jgi:hypothetical protein
MAAALPTRPLPPNAQTQNMEIKDWRAIKALYRQELLDTLWPGFPATEYPGRRVANMTTIFNHAVDLYMNQTPDHGLPVYGTWPSILPSHRKVDLRKVNDEVYAELNSELQELANVSERLRRVALLDSEPLASNEEAISENIERFIAPEQRRLPANRIIGRFQRGTARVGQF